MIKQKNLQEIEDYYLNQGFTGEELRKVLEKDKEFQELLKHKKAAIRHKHGITEHEERMYILPHEKDYEILAKDLEQKSLTEEDRILVTLIKSQLLEEWRKPLLDALNKLLVKYRK